jgi:hypothetical protein
MKPSPSKSLKTAGGKKRSREEAAGSAAGMSPPVSPPRPNPKQEWKSPRQRLKICWRSSTMDFCGRRKSICGVPLRVIRIPMEKNPDEIPMFTRFTERGLSLPASDFFKGLLEYYGTEYHNLNPNGIFHTSVFMHFCEAFLGIKPHWVLFQKFF